MNDAANEDLLARNMIDVHGAEAATIARGNARGAALSGQPAQAKSWIRVLGIVQWHQAGKASRPHGPGRVAAPIPIADLPVDDPTATPKEPHRPWLVPGAGSSF